MKNLLLSFLIFTAALTVKSQCRACDIIITNKIDCNVEITITYTCPGNPPMSFTKLLALGNSTSPAVCTLMSLFTTVPPCRCEDMIINSIVVFRVNGAPVSGTTVLGPSTGTFYPSNGCCATDYGKWSGCNVDLWMACP